MHFGIKRYDGVFDYVATDELCYKVIVTSWVDANETVKAGNKGCLCILDALEAGSDTGLYVFAHELD